MANVAVNRELHKAGDRSCMHIEIDIADSGIKYSAGKFLITVQPTRFLLLEVLKIEFTIFLQK